MTVKFDINEYIKSQNNLKEKVKKLETKKEKLNNIHDISYIKGYIDYARKYCDEEEKRKRETIIKEKLEPIIKEFDEIEEEIKKYKLQIKDIIDFNSFVEKIEIEESNIHNGCSKITSELFNEVKIDFSNLSDSDIKNIDKVFNELENEEEKISFLNQIVLFNKTDILLNMYKNNLNVLLLLDKIGIKTEYVDNFKKLQDINPGINPSRFKYNGYINLLQSSIFEKLGPQFICDIFEFEIGAISNTINNIDDPIIGKIINYLKINNLYSTKKVYIIMNFYEECSSLLSFLINKNYVLSNIEKNNLLLYFNHLEKEIQDREWKDFYLKLNLNINNIIDLRNYKDRYIERVYNFFNETNKIIEIKNIICFSLFGVNSVVLDKIYNNYMLEQLKENIDVFDETIKKVIEDINSSNSLDVIKQKYRDIVKKNISIVNRISKIENAIIKLNEKRVNKLLSKDQFKNSKITLEPFEDKKIQIIDLKGENFNLLIHGIAKDGGQDRIEVGKLAIKLYNDPSVWNGLDFSSTISCSFISDKYQGRAYQGSAVYYGFNDLPENEIILMADSDIHTDWGSNHYTSQNISIRNPNRIIKKTYINEVIQYQYNETAIYRKNKNVKNKKVKNSKKIQPSYIVSFSNPPTKIELKHAAYFEIPIICINEVIYNKINEEKTEKYKSGNLDKFTIEDVREILHLRSFTEEESINIIMNYLDNCNLSKQDFYILSNQIKNEFIDYFIDNKRDIDNALDILNQHINIFNLNYSEESVNNGFTK